ncbi:MAG: hypothetical protein DRG87_09550 [Deltaproteobacteria bacterium]|nr:MAG: hypothetical protein DRG87_09550 [Deltaproteobacteria bacterium]
MTSRDLQYSRLAQIAITDFSEIVEGTKIIEGKLRILIKDGSFIDIWLSEKKRGVYAYHWERRAIDGTIYRHNNLPDKEARKLKTFPKHFHEKSEEIVKESYISDIPEEAFSSFLIFARELLKSSES